SALTFMPAGIWSQYGTAPHDRQTFAAELAEPGKPARSGEAMAVPDLESFAARGQALIGQPVRAVVVNHPGDAAARVGIYGWNSDADADKRLSPNTGMAMFSAASGELLQLRMPGKAEGGGASLAQSVMGGLHM